MKKEELLSIGLTEEQAEQVFALHGKDIEKHKKAVEDAKSELSALQGQLEQRDKDMEELKKSAADAEGIKKQLEDLQSKYSAETEQYKAQLADRDYADAVARAIADKGVKFSSKAAEKAFLADLKANRLEMKDGGLVGFEDYHKAQLEADPAAFQTDKPAPAFVRPVGPGGPPATESKGAMFARQFSAQYAPTTKKE